MSALTYWQAKIWGLLHDPALKALHSNFSDEGQWNILQCMQGWQSPKNPQAHSQTDLNGTWLKYVGLSDLIASASDRNTVGRLPANQTAIRYNNEGLQIRHLLSGKPQTLILEQWHQQINDVGRDKREIENWEKVVIPDEIKNSTDPQKVFWWLWRCYIPALANALGGESDEQAIHLLPAETRFPDASLWSHVTMTSALAGGLAGYYQNPEDYPQKGKSFERSRPYVATFSFTPIQDLIKASRKMRDFWAGSWLLHYLSAKVCWAVAQKYGPDSLLYPCLYAQPLIDHWLLEKYPYFKEWIKQPSEQQLLTAGFPNVLVMILPNNGKASDEVSGNPVQSAVKYAEDILKQEWKKLGDEVLDFLQKNDGKGGKQWRGINLHTWDGWLKSQWQIYWTALPIGETKAELHQSPRKTKEYEEWIEKQNNFANPHPELFVPPEYKFLEAVFKATVPTEAENPDIAESTEEYKARQPNMNVGSWWASIFDQTRFALNAVKNARIWQLPTAFSPRSTVSGIGSVVHPIYDPSKPDWAKEGQTADFWAENMGLFDGIEELNATEVLKRGLHQILGKVLSLKTEDRDRSKIPVLYPDLSSGVAGWLRQMEAQGNQEVIAYFQTACQTLIDKFDWADKPANLPWGIPWIAKNHPEWSNPRLLNAGWLIDDYHPSNPDDQQAFTRQQQKQEKNQELKRLREQIGQLFKPGNNPTDWYVLAAGDGDGMGDWLKGVNLQPYSAYIPDELHQKIPKMPDNIQDYFQEFLHIKKRMGPSTHSALSRALLDFSNQLVPYLTEERYAGRLIYGGGDDVLAYTNLWEWDKWLWDIRQCFRGGEDPNNDEFASQGDYWRWNQGKPPENLTSRPLFTMGSTATISFGVVIAHHSVPLAIALENLWEAEEKAKEHKSPNGDAKDAVQVRVLYGNGNILKSTAKFDVFNQWKNLLNISVNLESSIFEQAAEIWEQHPAPVIEAIAPWANVFCDRRDIFKKDESAKKEFQALLAEFLQDLSITTKEKQCDNQIQSWLKLAAFILRNRTIKI